MPLSSKKLWVISLASLSVLVIAFIFVAVSFTSSSTLARPTQQNSPTLPPPISREVYQVTANGGDVSRVNIRQKLNDGSCPTIGNGVKINTIVAIRGTSSDNTIECYNDEGVKITLYRLSEDSRRTGRYIAAANIVERPAKQAFNDQGKALVSQTGLNIYDRECLLLNRQDRSIPKPLPKDAIVSVSDLNNIKTKICVIEVGFIYYRFEMVEVNYTYTYRVGREEQTKTVTGYVAQEFLRPAK